MSNRFRHHWPYLFVSIAPLILFAHFLLGQRVLYWGTLMLQFYPWRKFALDILYAGHLPLWNPYLGNGAPLIANHQSALFYPPNWISLLLPLDYSLGWLAALHLVWAGIGMVTLARALGFRPLGQVVAGLAFGLSQYLVARVLFLSINSAVAWLPWIIWAAEQGLRLKAQGASAKDQGPTTSDQQPDASYQPLATSNQPPTPNLQPTVPYSLLLSLFIAMQLLAGHAQTAWYTLLLLAAWIVWRLITFTANQPASLNSSVPDHSSRVTGHLFSSLRLPSLVIFHLSFFIFFAFLLSALQLLPTAELLRESPRATSAEYEFVMTYSYSPWRLLTLFAPDLLGNPARGKFYGYGNYWEDADYLGLLPLLLAAFVILQTLKHLFVLTRNHLVTLSPCHLVNSSTFVIFLLFILSLSLTLALGRNTPIFPFFYKYLPTFNLFQAPTRLMLWFVFALALLAGLGADRWPAVEGSSSARAWMFRAAAGAASMALTSVAVLFVIPLGTELAAQLHTVARAFALAGLGLFIALILLSLKPKTDSLRWEISLALFLTADLLFAGRGLNPGATPNLYRSPTTSGAALTAVLKDHRLFQFPDDEYHVKFERLISFKNFGPPELARATREAQLPNLALLEGLPSANNFDPLVSARYAGFIEVISQTHSLNLLRLMDVQVIASSAPLALQPIAQVDATTFYLVPGEPRRVWTVYASRTVANADSARAAIAAPNFDPGSQVILEADDPGVSVHHSLANSLTGTPNAVTIPVSLSQPGWVVLSDTYYPGWVVFVDHQPAKLLHANYAFRAVKVEAGEHTVDFRYEPRSFQIGLWISGVSWLLWIAAALFAWTRRDKREN